MSREFWFELAAIGEGVLIVILFVRLSRVESIVRGMLGGWKKHGR